MEEPAVEFEFALEFYRKIVFKCSFQLQVFSLQYRTQLGRSATGAVVGILGGFIPHYYARPNSEFISTPQPQPLLPFHVTASRIPSVLSLPEIA
jgi:hypothetical protein